MGCILHQVVRESVTRFRTESGGSGSITDALVEAAEALARARASPTPECTVSVFFPPEERGMTLGRSCLPT